MRRDANPPRSLRALHVLHVLVVVLLAFTVVQLALWIAHPGPVAGSVDGDLPRYAAASRSWAQVFTVQGFGPLGYPLLLKTARLFVDDALWAARVLSLLASLGSLLLVFLLVRRGAGPTWGALAVLGLAAHGYFHETALLSGPAALAGCAALGSVALTLRWYEHPTRGRALTAGALLGGLALLRADALAPVFCFALGLALVERRRGRWLFAAGAALVFAPQVILSLAQHGVLLYSTQAKNVWFGIHGGMHWEDSWHQVPDSVSLREVIAADPLLFLRHWSGESVNALRRLLWMVTGTPPVYLLRVLPTAAALVGPVGAVLGCGAFAWAVWRDRTSPAPDHAPRAPFVLAGLALVVWILSVSAVFSVHRVLVPAWLMVVVAAFVAIGRRTRTPGPRGRWWLAAALLAWYAPAAFVHVHTLLRYAATRGLTP